MRKITPLNVLLHIRDGNAFDFPSLMRALGLSQRSSAGLYVIQIVRQLAEVGFVIVEDQKEPSSWGETAFKISPTWQHVQTALGISLSQLSLLDHNSIIANPIFGSANEAIQKNQIDIFVLMPFRNELLPVFDDHIKKVAANLGLSLRRGDDFFTAASVMADIWKAINAARLIVADCTDRNPNVFYEIGLAHVLGKPVILITQNEEDVPFDLRHIRYLKYQLTPRGMKTFEEQLERTITYTLADLFHYPGNDEGI